MQCRVPQGQYMYFNGDENPAAQGCVPGHSSSVLVWQSLFDMVRVF